VLGHPTKDKNERNMVSSTPNKKKHVTMSDTVNEKTPLNLSSADSDDDSGGQEYFSNLKGDSVRRESILADQLSMRLLAVADDDSDAEDAILYETLNMSNTGGSARNQGSMDVSARSQGSLSYRDPRIAKQAACSRLCGMVGLVVMGLALLFTAFILGVQFIGPPNQPVGPYHLVERQVCGFLFGKDRMDDIYLTANPTDSSLCALSPINSFALPCSHCRIASLSFYSRPYPDTFL
jgi:hypothetical protein